MEQSSEGNKSRFSGETLWKDSLRNQKITNIHKEGGSKGCIKREAKEVEESEIDKVAKKGQLKEKNRNQIKRVKEAKKMINCFI
jgi:hypothetical protein